MLLVDIIINNSNYARISSKQFLFDIKYPSSARIPFTNLQRFKALPQRARIALVPRNLPVEERR